MVNNKTNKKNKRIGETKFNNSGSKMEIIEYRNNEDMTVKFDNGYISDNIRYTNFRRGRIVSPLCKTAFGIGFIGIGTYKVTNNGKMTREYARWRGMLDRCYKYPDKYSSYSECLVCDEWHNFQNFARWFNDNYYEVKGHKMDLDKDILIKGNKVYSPETCSFVTKEINALFLKNDISRGSCPIGVYWDESKGKYASECSIPNSKKARLGLFDNEFDAFLAYKHKKEEVIKQMADKCKNDIPQRLYDAMYSYEVEITD